MPEMVYKICTSEAWDLAVQRGRFAGSADDLRDGFIHLSTRQQVEGTLIRHFSEQAGGGLRGLVLVSIDPARLGPELRWEPARDGSLFPHLYGPLDPGLADRVLPLEVGSDGRHLIPGDL